MMRRVPSRARTSVRLVQLAGATRWHVATPVTPGTPVTPVTPATHEVALARIGEGRAVNGSQLRPSAQTAAPTSQGRAWLTQRPASVMRAVRAHHGAVNSALITSSCRGAASPPRLLTRCPSYPRHSPDPPVKRVAPLLPLPAHPAGGGGETPTVAEHQAGTDTDRRRHWRCTGGSGGWQGRHALCGPAILPCILLPAPFPCAHAHRRQTSGPP